MTETIHCAKIQAQAPVLKLKKGHSEEHNFHRALFKGLEGCLRKAPFHVKSLYDLQSVGNEGQNNA